MILVFFNQYYLSFKFAGYFIYLFVYATTNVQKLYKITNVMTKNLPRSYIKIYVTIISLVDSD